MFAFIHVLNLLYSTGFIKTRKYEDKKKEQVARDLRFTISVAKHVYLIICRENFNNAYTFLKIFFLLLFICFIVLSSSFETSATQQKCVVCVYAYLFSIRSSVSFFENLKIGRSLGVHLRKVGRLSIKLTYMFHSGNLPNGPLWILQTLKILKVLNILKTLQIFQILKVPNSRTIPNTVRNLTVFKSLKPQTSQNSKTSHNSQNSPNSPYSRNFQFWKLEIVRNLTIFKNFQTSQNFQTAKIRKTLKILQIFRIPKI